MRYKIFPYEPTAIFAADTHVRSTIPKCRTDNYLLAQEKKLLFLFGAGMFYNVPIIIAGDFSDTAEMSNWLVTQLFIMLRQENAPYVGMVPGQHDLPNHRLSQWKRSGAASLHFGLPNFEIYTTKFGRFPSPKFSCCFFPYDTTLENWMPPFNDHHHICIAHKMVIENKKLWPGQVVRDAKWYLKKHKFYNVIVTGDNHLPFVVKYKRRLLVNPGSMMRMKADQMDHRPRAYLWFSYSNHVEPLYFPIEKGVVSDKHILDETERKYRVKAYVARLKKRQDFGLSFKENMKTFIRENKLFRRSRSLRNKIWSHVK